MNLTNIPYELTKNEISSISLGYLGGKVCPLEIWIYDQYRILPTGCIAQYAIALAFINNKN